MMISGASSSCSASAAVATMSCVSTAIRPWPARSRARRRARCWRGRPGRRSGPVANQPSRISSSTGWEVERRLSASTLASFQVRAPRAVSASAHSAARIPGDLVGGDRRAGARPAADDALLAPRPRRRRAPPARRPRPSRRARPPPARRARSARDRACAARRATPARRACPCRSRPRSSPGAGYSGHTSRPMSHFQREALRARYKATSKDNLGAVFDDVHLRPG